MAGFSRLGLVAAVFFPLKKQKLHRSYLAAQEAEPDGTRGSLLQSPSLCECLGNTQHSHPITDNQRVLLRSCKPVLHTLTQQPVLVYLGELQAKTCYRKASYTLTSTQPCCYKNSFPTPTRAFCPFQGLRLHKLHFGNDFYQNLLFQTVMKARFWKRRAQQFT